MYFLVLNISLHYLMINMNISEAWYWRLWFPVIPISNRHYIKLNFESWFFGECIRQMKMIIKAAFVWIIIISNASTTSLHQHIARFILAHHWWIQWFIDSFVIVCFYWWCYTVDRMNNNKTVLIEYPYF